MNELDDARASFDRAVKFLHSGNAPMTERISRAALEDYPGEINFLALLAASLLRQGRADEAESRLREAIAAEPGYAKAHEQLGETLLALGRAEEAVESFRRALELNPAFDSAQMQLGRTLLALGRDAEADAVFESFVRRDPHRERLAEAVELHRNGHYERAENICREILEQDRKNVTAIRLLAMIAMRAEHFRDAVVLLKQVVKLAPDYRGAWLDLGQAQTEAHDLEDAIGTMGHAIAMDPNGHAAYIGLANALARSSRDRKSVV